MGRPRRRLGNNFNMEHRKQNLGVQTGFMWLHTGTGGELLWTRL
jgi:hypothetical protein